MARRLVLQKKFEQVLGTRNVYFQPPENLKISYPCIIYRLSPPSTNHADDILYKQMDSYTVLYVTKDPDDPLIRNLLGLFPYLRLNQHYVSDNLNHYSYTLFF